METREEQAHYGSRCMHGTSIGTPGGYDLMCGDCEMGYTKWIEDPLYQFVPYVVHNDRRQAAIVDRVYYRPSYDDELVEKVVTWMLAIASVFKDVEALPDYHMEYEFEYVEAGYWDTP